jgi:hypothetical protein
VYEPVVTALPSLGIWLLAAGGALYSVGVVFLCVAEFEISKCDLARVCIGCRMLSLCGCAFLCGEWVDLNGKTASRPLRKARPSANQRLSTRDRHEALVREGPTTPI